jgi:hypothetical protein
VLDAIARALHLPEADRRYLHRLATPAPRQTPHPAFVRRLAAEMSATSDLFRRVWDEQTVSLADRGRKRLHHPQAGTVEFGVTFLHARDPGEQVLMVLTPEPGSEDERAWHAAMAG